MVFEVPDLFWRKRSDHAWRVGVEAVGTSLREDIVRAPSVRDVLIIRNGSPLQTFLQLDIETAWSGDGQTTHRRAGEWYTMLMT